MLESLGDKTLDLVLTSCSLDFPGSISHYLCVISVTIPEIQFLGREPWLGLARVRGPPLAQECVGQSNPWY